MLLGHAAALVARASLDPASVVAFDDPPPILGHLHAQNTESALQNELRQGLHKGGPTFAHPAAIGCSDDPFQGLGDSRAVTIKIHLLPMDMSTTHIISSYCLRGGGVVPLEASLRANILLTMIPVNTGVCQGLLQA